MYTTTYPENWTRGGNIPLLSADQPAKLVMSSDSWAYAGQFQDSVSPLDTMKLVDRTYVGEMGNASMLGNVVDMYRERASEDLTGPRSVGVLARTWSNGFHRMLAKGQPMFCIDDPSWDKDALYDSNNTSAYNVRDHTMYPACMVSGPQLVSILKTADSTLGSKLASDSSSGSAASGAMSKICCPSTQRRFNIAPRRPKPQSTAAATSASSAAAAAAATAPTPTPSMTGKLTSKPPKTTSLSDVVKMEEEKWAEQDAWKNALEEGPENCSIIRLANITNIRKTVRYVGFLTEPPDACIPSSEFGSIMMDIASLGDVRCMNYWGRKITKGDCVGFILKRRKLEKDNGDIPKHYMLEPWSSRSRKWPTDEELKSYNYGNILKDTTRDGIFFYVGKVVHIELGPVVGDVSYGQCTPDVHYNSRWNENIGDMGYRALGIFPKEDEIDVARAMEETRMTRDVVVVNLGHGPSNVM